MGVSEGWQRWAGGYKSGSVGSGLLWSSAKGGSEDIEQTRRSMKTGGKERGENKRETGINK